LSVSKGKLYSASRYEHLREGCARYTSHFIEWPEEVAGKDGLLKKPRIFYGYWILTACFVINMIGTGCSLLSFSLFVTPLETDMGWSRTELMAAFTILLACIALTSPFAGRLIDRYGARKVISVGTSLTVIGFVLLSQMNSLWHYYIGYIIIGVGTTGISHITTSCVISHWFIKRRGMAIGIMAMGMGLSGIVYAPFVAVYLIPHFGWSNAYLSLAVTTGGVIIPLSLLVIRTKPADLGLLPDGTESWETATMDETRVLASEGLSLKTALSTPVFWLLAASFFLYHNCMGVLQNLVPHLRDIGFPIGIVAATISITATMSTAGTFFFGWLCDKIPAKFACVVGICSTVVGILILINIGAGSPVWMIWLYAVIVGFSLGNWMPTMSMLTSTSFGLAYYGTIFGMLSLFQSLGAAMGPLWVGYLYDSMNTYHWAFIIIMGMIVLAIPLVLSVRRPAYRT